MKDSVRFATMRLWVLEEKEVMMQIEPLLPMIEAQASVQQQKARRR